MMVNSGPFDDTIPEESGAYSGDVFDAEKKSKKIMAVRISFR